MASQGNIYFLRSFLLLIEGGLYISKEILRRECQKSENDLDQLLKIDERKLKHLFHGKLCIKLYPESGKADINTWDLQLSVGVLINVFGRNIKMVEKQKLRALRDIRNDIYMHCATADLDENKYEEVKEELDDIITTLASSFDISVQQRCSNCIKQFTTGPLDAVRPSLQTLNGLSQSCQKTLTVGAETKLVIVCPSDDWISLCEYTLLTIFNRAETMASQDGGFREIENNVREMLSFLERNIGAVFKGCRRKCIILSFECKSYESFLDFLHTVECQEFTCYLRSLSNSLHSFFKPGYPISITSKVTSECLQSELINIIKTFSNEEEGQRHVDELSSEENIHESMAMTMASCDVNKGMMLTDQSETSLLLNFELKSEEDVLHILQSIQGNQFSDRLKKVADSLSRYYECEITLRASMNVGAMVKSLEESVSNEVKVATETKESEMDTLLLMQDTVALQTTRWLQMDNLHLMPDEEKTNLAYKIRIMKSVKFLREEYVLEKMMPDLSRNGLLSLADLKPVGMSREKRKVDILISMVLTRPKRLLQGFKQCLQNRDYDNIRRTIDSKLVTLKDIKVLMKLEASIMMTKVGIRPNCGFPLIKFNIQQRLLCFQELENANDIAASLLSRMMISGKEFLEISQQPTRSKSIFVLLDILEKCSKKHLVDFCSALRENGYKDVSQELMRLKRVKQRLNLTQPHSKAVHTQCDILQQDTENFKESDADSEDDQSELDDLYNSSSETESVCSECGILASQSDLKKEHDEYSDAKRTLSVYPGKHTGRPHKRKTHPRAPTSSDEKVKERKIDCTDSNLT